ncbi:MAG: SbtR family transcriptional regulator [Solirubrobacteraceae bacterium]
MSAVLRGRQAEAARNHERLMRAAREVLAATPDAPIAQVASHAGVGVATLYRRYASREALVAETWLESVREVEAQARVALDRARMFPWGAFVGFMTASVASGMAALAAALAEAGAPAEDLVAAERSMCAAIGELLEVAQQAGAVRPDVGVEDVRLLFEQLHAVRAADAAREATLRRRYLELVLQALRAPAAAPLPGPAPTATELRGRYDGR